MSKRATLEDTNIENAKKPWMNLKVFIVTAATPISDTQDKVANHLIKFNLWFDGSEELPSANMNLARKIMYDDTEITGNKNVDIALPGSRLKM